ncbi:MAG: AAA family ATPase, partial [Syntrophomonas sp.]
MVISVINNKGGTGKTSVAVNLAAALASSGPRVLLIDLDSQASAAFHLGVARNDLQPSTADILFNELPITKAKRPTGIRDLELVTGGMELAHSDLMLADVAGREECLFKAIDPVRNKYDFIICDCSPSLSILSVNALVASDYYIVPITPQYLALEGLIS